MAVVLLVMFVSSVAAWVCRAVIDAVFVVVAYELVERVEIEDVFAESAAISLVLDATCVSRVLSPSPSTVTFSSVRVSVTVSSFCFFANCVVNSSYERTEEWRRFAMACVCGDSRGSSMKSFLLRGKKQCHHIHHVR
jgi:hypothetical protein